jgi:hypothetical protein
MSKSTTPWGPAQVVDAVKVDQKADDREFASLVQLLETTKGERLVRFSYSTDGIARRGPVTMRATDLKRLRRALEKHPELKEALLG